MKFNFDDAVDRTGTDSLKHDFKAKYGKPDDALALWVADMDFRTVPEAAAAVAKTASHGIYGYTEPGENYYEVLSDWFGRRFGYPVNPAWVVKTPGVVFAVSAAIRALTSEGDAVIFSRPLYSPLIDAVTRNGRVPVNCPLVEDGAGRHVMDFDAFEEAIVANSVKMFLLCSPHNPTGRVWTREELERVSAICIRHGVIVVSDEIHCDFVFGDSPHTLFTSLSPEAARNTVLCTSPSKTFNLAGLQVSNIIIPDARLRRLFVEEIARTGYSQLNTAGLAACRSVYGHGEEWLEELLVYLKANMEYVSGFVASEIKGVKAPVPEGTYLMWLDFRESGVDASGLDSFITGKAKLWLSAGEGFGAEGRGFARLNAACPRKTLEEAMGRLKKAFS